MADTLETSLENNDISGSEGAYTTLLPEVEADIEEPRPLNTDLRAACLIALEAHDVLTLPEHIEELKQLPSQAFDMEHVRKLKPAALACLYVGAQAETLQNMGSERVPQVLYNKGVALCDSMEQVLRYNLRDNPEVVKFLDGMPRTNSRAGLISRLAQNIQLYRDHAAMLQRDRYYDAGDVDRAHAIHEEIVKYLSRDHDSVERRWANLKVRFWSKMANHYEHARRASQFLFYNRPHILRQVPSLYGTRRARQAAEAEGVADAST